MALKTQTFNNFDTNTNPLSGDFLVGVLADGSAEFKAPIGNIGVYVKNDETNAIQTILGGNTASGDCAVVSGGSSNIANGLGSVISGGRNNLNSGCHSVIAGGSTNTVADWHSVIGGGYGNVAGYPQRISINTSIASSNGDFYINIGCGVRLYNYQNNSYIYKDQWSQRWFLSDNNLETNTFYTDDITSNVWTPLTGGTFYEADYDSEEVASVIGGGKYNKTSGFGDVIGGGIGNITSSGYNSNSNSNDPAANVISGGWGNTISAYYGQSTVGGGSWNNINGVSGNTISGGWSNSSSGYNSTVSGGSNNDADANCAAIGGGSNNSVYDSYSTIAGGDNNRIDGSYSSIGGGYNNCAGTCQTIGGGYNNCSYSTRGGTIAGGHNNKVEGTYSVTIGGGSHNYACGSVSVIAGGCSNNNCGYHATISGGANNTITSGNYSSIVSGYQNAVNHDNSHVIGSEITTNKPNFTFVNNVQSFGAVKASQGVPSGDNSTTGFSFGADGDTGLFSPITGGEGWTEAGNGRLALYANGETILSADNGGLTRLKLGGVVYTLSVDETTNALTLNPV